jgi:hypothetical protein
MPERAAIFQVVQLGVEASGAAGTAVAATKRLQSVSLDPDPQANIDTFKPTGAKYLGVAALGQESSAFRLGGRPVYDELQYVLASVLDRPAITNPATPATPLARYHTFISETSAADDPATFTVEQGAIGATDGDRYAGVILTEAGLTFTRQSVELSGAGIGRAMSNPFTMTTAGITALPQIPILPGRTDVYLDTTSAGLGTTKLLRCFRAEWRVGGRYDPIWPLNSANASFETTAEADPDMTLTLRVVSDTAGMALYNTYMKQGTGVYLRVKNTSTQFIDTGSLNPYELRIDMAGVVTAVGGKQIDQSLQMIEFTLSAQHDQSWGTGKSHEVRLTNKQTALT